MPHQIIRILLLEDNEPDVQLFKERLKDSDYVNISFRSAPSLKEGVDLLYKHEFDIVLTDLGLVDTSGLDTVYQLKIHTDKVNLPFVVLTGSCDNEFAEKCLTQGAEDYIEKNKFPEISVLKRILKFSIDRYKFKTEVLKTKSEYQKNIQDQRALFIHIINAQKDGILLVNPNCEITFVNSSAQTLLECKKDQLLNKNISSVLHQQDGFSTLKSLLSYSKLEGYETQVKNLHNEVIEAWVRVSVIRDKNKSIDNIVITITDLTQYNKIKEENDAISLKMEETQKMESIGHLSAGIAHEINTPAQFINDNLQFLKCSMRGGFNLINKLGNDLKENEVSIDTIKENFSNYHSIYDIDYLQEEMPNAINQSIEGIERVSTIVKAMKDFSHPGSEEGGPFDLNESIKNTSVVCKNEWKYLANLSFELDESLPMIYGHSNLIKQVFLNMIVNAAHAIDERNKNKEEIIDGEIFISTSAKGELANITIKDNGNGIPDKSLKKIFDLFYTTKEVGKGTGQGLSMVYKTIVEKHQGTINVESTVGEGTTFVIELPIKNQQEELKVANS
jgi:PAS domain S-box-containing protein